MKQIIIKALMLLLVEKSVNLNRPQILIAERRSKALVKREVLRDEEITRLHLCFTSRTIEGFAALNFFAYFFASRQKK